MRGADSVPDGLSGDRKARRTFAARVVAWQREHGRRDLPWQQSRDPYRIWLSEIMLQQTQVATVLRYFERFIDAFPDVAALADAPLSRVLELWSGLGYYRRAHHLHAAAREVVGRFGARFPTDASTLATLPGIGRSTGAAIAAFAANERAAILDGNVKRVIARHAEIEGWAGNRAVATSLWRQAESLLPAQDDDIGTYTQGMMDLGATVCTRSRPRCSMCPVAGDCAAHRQGRVGELPTPRPRKVLPRREVVVLLIEHEGRVLLERRPPTGVWPGLLGLPEVAVGEDIVATVLTRFGAAPCAIEHLPPLTHAFTHFVLEMRPARVFVESTATPVAAMPSCEWLDRRRTKNAALPAPVRALLEMMLEHHDR